MFSALFAAAWYEDSSNWLMIIGIIALIIVFIALVIFFRFVRLWIQCLLAGAKVGVLDMVRMKLLNVDYSRVVRWKIALAQAGVKVAIQEMEALYPVRWDTGQGRSGKSLAGSDRRQQGEHGPALAHGSRHRVGRPRHPRSGPYQREPEGD